MNTNVKWVQPGTPAPQRQDIDCWNPTDLAFRAGEVLIKMADGKMMPFDPASLAKIREQQAACKLQTFVEALYDGPVSQSPSLADAMAREMELEVEMIALRESGQRDSLDSSLL